MPAATASPCWNEPAVAGDGLDGVADRVAEVEHGPQARLLALVRP